MAFIAGSDLAVQPVGRYLSLQGCNQVERPGFVMPLCTPLPSFYPSASDTEKLEIINQVEALVHRLHAKQIIHGDVKPNNIVRCTDGRLRFIDFANACVEGTQLPPDDITPLYASAYRTLYINGAPILKEDDLYALGISIWEIWMGKPESDAEGWHPNLPFYGEWAEEEILTYIAAGAVPDLDRISDPVVRKKIAHHLSQGPPMPKYCYRAWDEKCTSFRMYFCECENEEQPHSFLQVNKCFKHRETKPEDIECVYNEAGELVRGIYELPRVIYSDGKSDLICPKCHPTHYVGLI